MKLILKILFILLISNLYLLAGYKESHATMYCKDGPRDKPLYSGSDERQRGIPSLDEAVYLEYGNSPTGDDVFDPQFRAVRYIRIFNFWDIFHPSRLGYFWTDKRTATWNTNQFGLTAPYSQPKTLKGGALGLGTLPNLCLVRYKPGEGCYEGEKNNDIRAKICGYVVASTAWGCGKGDVGNALGLNWNYAKIGCIHEKGKPGPPPFNPVMIANVSPRVKPIVPYLETSPNDTTSEYQQVVSELISYGSAFMQPVIRLTDGRTAPNFLYLRYVYPGDSAVDEMKICDSFDSSLNVPGVYCVEINPETPNLVCACVDGECPIKDKTVETARYLGCVPRPTPKQSGYKIFASYSNQVKYDDGKVIPSIIFNYIKSNASGDLFGNNGTVQYRYNSQDQSYYKDGTKVNIYLQQLDRLINNISLSEYFLGVNEDNTSQKSYFINSINYNIDPNSINPTFGLEFNNIIPEVDSQGNPVSVYILPPTPDTSKVCQAPALTSASTQGSSVFVLPSFDRTIDPTICQPIYPTYKECSNQQFFFPTGNKQIDYAYCPGIFNQQVGKLYSICLIPNINWPAMYDELNVYHSLCAPIPVLPPPSHPPGCVAESPTKDNGYVAWPFMNFDTSQTGRCDGNAGLEPQFAYMVTPPKLNYIDYCNEYVCRSSLYTYYASAFDDLQSQLDQAITIAQQQSRNLFPYELLLFNSALSQLPIITSSKKDDREYLYYTPSPHTLDASITTISKKCDINPQDEINGISKITGKCVYKPGCNPNSNSYPFLGNMFWSSLTEAAIGNLATKSNTITPDNIFNNINTLNWSGITYNTNQTSIYIKPLPAPANGCQNSSMAVKSAQRKCNAYFDQNMTFLGSVWSDVDTSQPAVKSCIDLNAGP